MDVSCGRCKTEYEFDDALISERGTTVRCTNCGLEFKIFPHGAQRAPEVWEVRVAPTTPEGARRFESLGDLQRAIARGEVTSSEYLVRGEEVPRLLATIAELEPLLRQPKSTAPPPVAVEVPVRRAASGTALGLPSIAASAHGIESMPSIPAALPHADLPLDSTTRGHMSPAAVTTPDFSDPEPSAVSAKVATTTAVSSPTSAASNSADESQIDYAAFVNDAAELDAQADGATDAAVIAALPSVEDIGPPPLPAVATPAVESLEPAESPESIRDETIGVDDVSVDHREVEPLPEEAATKSSVEPAPAAEPAPPALDASKTIVQGTSQGPVSVAPISPREGASRRRIQSALSFAGSAEAEVPVSDRVSLEPSPLSGRSHLPSLSSTLLTRTPGHVMGASVPPPLSSRGDRRSSYPPPSPRTAARTSEVPESPRRPSFMSPSLSADAPGQNAPSLPAQMSAAPLSPPRISDSGQYPGNITPTPTAMRAFRGPEVAPVSAGPTSMRRRGARSGLIIGSILLGGILFFALTGSDKIKSLLGTAQGEAAPETAGVADTMLGPEWKDRLTYAEVAFFRRRLREEGSEERRNAEELLSKELPAWLSEIAALPRPGADVVTAHLDLLRIAGRAKEARALVASSRGVVRPYSLALLDLVEQESSPPWPAIVGRLEEARTGERGDYLATSALLYALGASGRVDEARAKWDELGSLDGGKSAPLYADLEAFLTRLKQSDGLPQADVEVPPVDLSGPTPPAPSSKVEWTPPPKATSAKVGDDLKKLVDDADTLWRGGNRETAIVLYRQVIGKVGSSHFLGQRAASRIAQAERERGGAE